MTARGTMETVMAATRNGAFDYLAKPFELDTLLEAVKRAIASRASRTTTRSKPEELPESEMIGSSAGMVEIYKTVAQVAPTDATVVILGETGTGKELVARMIHRYSHRAAQSVCARGLRRHPADAARKRIIRRHEGRVYRRGPRPHRRASKRPIEAPCFWMRSAISTPAFQVKLLRFLQEREIRPVGSSREKKVDVRVVVATNRDLQKMVEEGKFREDLWFRLNVVRLDDAAAARAPRRCSAAGALFSEQVQRAL